MHKDYHHMHFVGIGGIGMSGIAEVLLSLGYQVSGSDLASSSITKRLKKLGAKIYKGHKASNLKKCDVVVTSTAVSKKNPEVVKAKKLKIPVIPRAQMLAELMHMKNGIAVAGTHGKTTTTSILGSLLTYCKVDPTVVIGGKLNRWGTNAKVGKGDFMVAEADESDGSFNLLSPTMAIVTNIDNDHLDHYKDIHAVKKAFIKFLNNLPVYGLAVVCGDDKYVKSVLPKIKNKVVTYGVGASCDFQAKNIKFNGIESSFDVMGHKKKNGRFKIKAPGFHNVNNALSCIVLALYLGLKVSKIKKGLLSYEGVQRRFQIKGQAEGVIVVDDYGHHPTEVKATLETVKKVWPKRRLLAVFQPHRYTRTRDCFKEFTVAFKKSDVLLLAPIYAAGEKRIKGISSQKLFEAIKKRQKNIFVSDSKNSNSISQDILSLVKKGDVVLTLGAGDIWKSGEKLLAQIKGKRGRI